MASVGEGAVGVGVVDREGVPDVAGAWGGGGRVVAVVEALEAVDWVLFGVVGA